jgi:hypothetical protein
VFDPPSLDQLFSLQVPQTLAKHGHADAHALVHAAEGAQASGNVVRPRVVRQRKATKKEHGERIECRGMRAMNESFNAVQQKVGNPEGVGL